MMLFRQSAVVSTSHDRVVEESQTLPVDIHPALVGSGRLALSLDATGMQGVNSFLGHYPDCYSLEHTGWMAEKHLHVYRDRCLSLHYAPEVSRGFSHANPAYGPFSLLPLGYLEYDVHIDGECFNTTAIRDSARAWRREFEPRRGVLRTSFELPGVRVEWTTCPALDAVSIPFELSVTTTDGKPHALSVNVLFRLALRDGRPIAVGGTRLGRAGGADRSHAWMTWDGRSETSAAAVYEPVHLRWTLAATAPGPTETDTVPPTTCAGGSDDASLSVAISTTDASLHGFFGLVVGADYDDTNTPQYADRIVASIGATTIDDAAATWEDYFAGGAQIVIGEGDRELLHSTAQYTLRAGAPWDNGCPLGTLWTQKFGAMTFWDTFFACDGLLRAGHVEPIRRFADWCVRTAAPEGRPHYWMSWYDGVPGSNPETDEGYQSTLAFAQSIIRLVEVTGDPDDLRLRAIPYLRRLTTYAFRSLLGHAAGRGWHLVGTVAGDVGVESNDASRENVIFAWLLSCVGKFVEYADRLGESDALVERAREVIEDRRRPGNRLDITVGQWAGWAPNLTQSRPFADYDGWARWMERQVASRPLAMQQIMPWLSGNVAVSCAVAGTPNVALHAIEHADLHVSGLGYLGESLWEFKCGGNTPYVPSSGVYLAAYSALIADGSIWDDRVDLLTNLPERWKNNRLRWCNVVTLNGCRTGGTYTPFEVAVDVSCTRDVELRLTVPSRIVGNILEVNIGDTRREVDTGDTSVAIRLPQGRHTVSVRRSEGATADVLLIEPSVHGAPLRRILAGGTDGSPQHRVFWLRDTESLPMWATRSPVIVIDQQYVMLRPDHVEALKTAVRAGARLICFNHAGARKIDWRMAKLTGVNGALAGDYTYRANQRTVELTDAGATLLPGCPRHFETWLTTDIEASLSGDVEVLAVLPEGAPTGGAAGRAAVTRRRVGQGWVAWACMGDKLMCRDDPQSEQPDPESGTGPVFSYGLAGGSPFLVYGRYPDEMSDPRWLSEKGFDALLAALAYAPWET